MSWDVVIFNSPQKIDNLEEIDDSQLEPIDFDAIFISHFTNIVDRDTAKEITGEGFSIVYYPDSEPETNTLLNLYGEKGLYELVILAKKSGWQIYDTSLDKMIDLDNPANNGYTNFQEYLQNITKGQ